MSHALVFTEQYTRRASRFIKRHPELKPLYLKTLQLLEATPFHPSLRLHALSGRLDGLHSVSINLSYRITLEFLIREQEIIPVNVGDHDAVYCPPPHRWTVDAPMRQSRLRCQGMRPRRAGRRG